MILVVAKKNKLVSNDQFIVITKSLAMKQTSGTVLWLHRGKKVLKMKLV